LLLLNRFATTLSKQQLGAIKSIQVEVFRLECVHRFKVVRWVCMVFERIMKISTTAGWTFWIKRNVWSR